MGLQGTSAPVWRNHWLISPRFELNANTLKFWARDGGASYDTSGEGTYIRVSTTTSDTTAFTDIIGSLTDDQTTDVYRHFGVDLSPYIGQNIYIAFVHHGWGTNSFAMDALQISLDTMLPQSTSLITEGEGVRLSWTEDPEAVKYTIYYSSDPTLTWDPLTTRESGSSLYLDATGLTTGFYQVISSSVNVYPPTK